MEVTLEESKRREVVLESYKGIIYRHKVEFEWVPRSCEKCQLFGHSTLHCELNDQPQEPAEASHCEAACKEKEGMRPGTYYDKLVSNRGNTSEGRINRPAANTKIWKKKSTQLTQGSQQKTDNCVAAQPPPSHIRKNDVNFPPLPLRQDVKEKPRLSWQEKGKEIDEKIDGEEWITQTYKSKVRATTQEKEIVNSNEAKGGTNRFGPLHNAT